jgi:hypothetical protein
MIRCHWCGARNYAIDSWCARCSRHLDWAPAPRPSRPEPRRPPRRRALALLVPAAVVLGVAIGLALPVASWIQAVGRAVTPAAADTAIRPFGPAAGEAATPSSPAPTPDTSPNSDTTTAPDATPSPDEESTPASGPPPSEPVPSAEEPSDDPTQAGQIPLPTGDPAATVARFYRAVSGHDFVAAAALWTPWMQTQYPPVEYIDHRFAATEAINLRAERVLGNGGGVALVYIEVVEIIDGQTRRWVGTWQLVDTASGWLLNRPNLRAAT